MSCYKQTERMIEKERQYAKTLYNCPQFDEWWAQYGGLWWFEGEPFKELQRLRQKWVNERLPIALDRL